MLNIQSYLKKLLFPRKNEYFLEDSFGDVRVLIEKAKKSVLETQRQKELLETMTHAMGGMVWIKKWDNITENYLYEFGNFMLCEKFFCFSEECLCDCTTHISGKSDVDLINEFRERTGLRHSYGDLCFSTDIHAMEQAILFHKTAGAQGRPFCRYIECGYIGKKALLLDVIKTPLFLEGKTPSKQNHTYSVGNACDGTNCCEEKMDLALSLLDKGRAERLSNSVIWIYPEQPASCRLLDKEMGRP